MPSIASKVCEIRCSKKTISQLQIRRFVSKRNGSSHYSVCQTTIVVGYLQPIHFHFRSGESFEISCVGHLTTVSSFHIHGSIQQSAAIKYVCCCWFIKAFFFFFLDFDGCFSTSSYVVWFSGFGQLFIFFSVFDDLRRLKCVSNFRTKLPTSIHSVCASKRNQSLITIRKRIKLKVDSLRVRLKNSEYPKLNSSVRFNVRLTSMIRNKMYHEISLSFPLSDWDCWAVL